MTRMKAKPGWVYIFDSGLNRYKIGLSLTDVERRRREVEKISGHRLTCVYSREFDDAYRAEYTAHFFACLYRKDGEWFTLSKVKLREVIRFIDFLAPHGRPPKLCKGRDRVPHNNFDYLIPCDKAAECYCLLQYARPRKRPKKGSEAEVAFERLKEILKEASFLAIKHGF